VLPGNFGLGDDDIAPRLATKRDAGARDLIFLAVHE
jgi:hypothetical protein